LQLLINTYIICIFFTCYIKLHQKDKLPRDFSALLIKVIRIFVQKIHVKFEQELKFVALTLENKRESKHHDEYRYARS
jgi:hypothetical protein